MNCSLEPHMRVRTYHVLPSPLASTPQLTRCICRMDDPFIWGVLPLRYHLNPSNHRWSLASYDVCFNKGRYDFSLPIYTYLPQRHSHKADTRLLVPLPHTDPSTSSGPSAKPYPPTGSTTPRTAASSNPPCAKPSDCSLTLLPSRTHPPRHPPTTTPPSTCSTPSAPQPRRTRTAPTAGTASPRPPPSQGGTTPGSTSSPRAGCTSIRTRRCGISNGAWRG